MAEKIKNQKKRKIKCNCLCCKYCNDYWTEYKPNPESIEQSKPNNKIKYRKKYFCDYQCYNCLKYINKKKRQWELYIATQGIEMDYKKNQPKIEITQIDVTKDKKSEVISKIKRLTTKEFTKLETKKDGNCMF